MHVVVNQMPPTSNRRACLFPLAPRSDRLRRGAVSPAVVWFGGSLVLLIGLVCLIASPWNWLGSTDRPSEPLVLYCAAGMRLPVEQIIADYQRVSGVEVQVHYGGSNTLLGQIELSRMGDLYLSADDSYLQLAKEKGLLAEVMPLAVMQAVVGVPRDNPRGIESLDHLLADDTRLVVANPEQAAVGKMVRGALREVGKWEAIEQQTTRHGVFKPTVSDSANDIKLGSVDAGFLWDAVAAQYPEIGVVQLPELAGAVANIGVGVIRSSKQPTEAVRFARYLAASDRGLKIFAANGYRPVEGEKWQTKPSLTFYAGAINRAALEPIIAEFEAREGVEVTTLYNGCGILTAQMRSIRDGQSGLFPDAFMACDSYYMDEVEEFFQTPVSVSSAQIVIAVAKGNPKQIHAIADLTKPGVRIALGQPDQCSIGVLSRRLLESGGVYRQVLEENVVTQVPTSALLVPSITTQAADAALVYITDAQAESARIDIIRIDSALARAVQPFGIARSSEHKQLGERLLDAISQSRHEFESAGFDWQLPVESNP